MKKNVWIGVVLIVLIVVGIAYQVYNKNMQERLENEKLRKNLAKFYEEYVATPHPEMPGGNITCNGSIIIDKNLITEKFFCTSTPLYSSIGEGWYVIARGNFSWATGHVNTICGENVPEYERIKKIYLNEIREGNRWCDVPCYDSLSPQTYEIQVSYLPKESELRKMFLDFDLNRIKSLILNSSYFIKLNYNITQEKPEHSFSFGFRMGWQIPHKYSLNVKFVNAEILNYSIKIGDYENRNKDCPNCKITKLNDNQIYIEGIRDYDEFPYLNVKWRPL